MKTAADRFTAHDVQTISLDLRSLKHLSKGKALVVKLVQDLIEKGTISWPPPEKKSSVKKQSDEYLKMKEDLLVQFQDTPISNLDLDGLTDTIVNTANVARAEGILELQLVEELLEAKKKALLHQGNVLN